MPNDEIEEFLKRAAQRRQSKAAGKPAPPAPKPRPEYTDARSERLPRAEPINEPRPKNRRDEEVVDAIVLEDPLDGQSVAEHVKGLKRERATRSSEAKARRSGGSVAPVDAVPVVTQVDPNAPRQRAPSIAPQTAIADNGGITPIDRLITLLRQPDGMVQAVLLQEILKRPTDRW